LRETNARLIVSVLFAFCREMTPLESSIYLWHYVPGGIMHMATATVADLIAPAVALAVAVFRTEVLTLQLFWCAVRCVRIFDTRLLIYFCFTPRH